ncbi:sensor histidine kinase [Jeotgalibacillus soli]|uniref:histidine kinase n=1 Tax=Jeotgalibacillus soli TaxID=889306 RepID=A0A0C2VK45_9BACL|nr:HAMP domain-containing sensor histidine kinase [Jeotgalibacillus soli]KIL49282.1 sporulation kinase B [Jeotgalibacillus soli]
MKEFNSLINFKLYRLSIMLVISLMLSGLIVVYMSSSEVGWGFYLHSLLVLLLSLLLLSYPKKETMFMRSLIILVGTVYFHTIFILYPETSSTLILLCLMPAASILFFQPMLFYFSLLLNGLFLTVAFSYIYYVDKGALYPHLYMDLIGNIINFLGSQALLFLVFYLSDLRIKRQQLYYEQIQQAERLKTAGQLAAAVAHEIRNPITVVKGFIQYYQVDQSLKKEMKDHFSLMMDELKAAETVISDFLSIANPINNKDIDTVNVKTALLKVADLIQSYALIQGITIKLDVEEDRFIACNLIEFKQLMINLLKNAIEASPIESSLVVTAKKRKNCIEIKVIDEGSGMTEEEMKFIGTPFYSLKNKGTGIGLMISFSIVQHYNGSIQFTSNKGKGTTVTMSFPSKKATAALG